MASRNPFFSMTAALARSPRVVLFRNGPDFDACCQLLNTIFGGGAGLVPLPHAVRMLGPRAALPVIVACGAFSFYTSQAIVIASCLVGEATYQGVARRTLGHIGAEVVRLLGPVPQRPAVSHAGPLRQGLADPLRCPLLDARRRGL